MIQFSIRMLVVVTIFSIISLRTMQAQPAITFLNKLHDFDTIDIGSNAKCRFVFKNTGNEPLLLSDVITSCGCTVAELQSNHEHFLSQLNPVSNGAGHQFIQVKMDM